MRAVPAAAAAVSAINFPVCYRVSCENYRIIYDDSLDNDITCEVYYHCRMICDKFGKGGQGMNAEELTELLYVSLKDELVAKVVREGGAL